MCGITGWVSFGRDLRDERGVLEAMTQTMECRGPDDTGVWLREHGALGHRRLAIVDLPGGHQPMTTDGGFGNETSGTVEGDLGSDDASVGIAYSGETYDFRELREELEALGHRFTSRSDTEVVLRGYLEWGTEVVEHLNGMFAFAIWDDRDERLHLVRDRMGVKPLYYFPTADGVLFGSEPKAILEHPDSLHRVTLDGLRELFSATRTPGHAVWEGMAEVEPGTVVTVDREGVTTHHYWSLETAPHPDSVERTVERVGELMDDIVERQLVADVPRCLLLSGGLDSSALTGLAARRLGDAGETARTFAVDFEGQSESFVPDDMRGTPDTPYVHDVAEMWATAHQDVVLDADRLADPEVRAATIRARDLPSGMGDIDNSLFLLFQAIREHSTVALSGESADEVFGGYAQFFDEEACRAEDFPWLAFAPIREHSRVADSALRPELRERLDLPAYRAERYAEAVAEIGELPGESEEESRMRRVSYLHLTRFVRILLDRKDRASMAVGLEVRVPFCDHRLVEYVYNSPWSMKSFDGREKSLLRAATADVLPESVRDRVKSPYPSTQDLGYVRRMQEQCAEILADTEHPVFEVIDRDWLAGQVALPAEEVGRPGIERTLDLHTWLDLYRPELVLA